MTRVDTSLIRAARRLAVGVAATAAAVALWAPLASASPETEAADAINAAWQAAGGAESVVGASDGETYQVGDGYARKFTEGKIFFTPDSGAHLLYGAVLDRYESLGGPADSDLGFPTLDEVPGLIGPESRVSTFNASDKPAIFWTPETGAWAVRGAINAAWDQLGGSAGTMGVPVEDERYDGDVVSQRFSGGEISWNSKDNTFTTVPAELAESLVGLEVPRDATTMINQAWRASGGLGGPLGARQGEQTAFGDGGAAQGYASGKIFYTPETGAHALTGAILSKYESLGGPDGGLGVPIGAEADGGAPNSRVSAFSAPDNPVIFWTPDTGAIVVRGAINAAWQQLGAATGSLGVPTGEQTSKGDTVTQKFSDGEISWNSATKEYSTNPAGLAADLSGMELPDAVAQAPAGTTPSEETGKGASPWWWLALIVPLLLLLPLLAVWARRRSGSAGGEDRDRDYEGGFFAAEDSGSRWPRGEAAPASWSGETEFGNDEDAIDTAPTRVPTEAELSGYEGFAVVGEGRVDSGRHSAESADSGSPVWRFDAEGGGGRRRRHAAEDADDEQQASEPVQAELWAAEFESVSEGYDSEREIVEDVENVGNVEDVVVETAEFTAEFGTGASSDPVAGALADQMEEPDQQSEPWRPAIHLPLADPYQPPEGYFIKANTHSGLYYTPDSALYDNTLPEVWFASEDVAQANGFVRAPE